ncbi:MAG TPA: Xaa-Pro aminopeptidase [Candidatus Saccharimonadia bacterium]|nr:Xaa-Pro aminopeptidase [Candidatus Saccharimonadia bacterium]
MRYQPLPAKFHADRRRQFMAQLPAGAVAIMDTNVQLVRSRDTHMPFRPDSYFYYLTGLDRPGAVLVLAGSEEWLFIAETDEQMRLWDGEAYTLVEAKALSGVAQVAWLRELPARLRQLVRPGASVYLNYTDAPGLPEAAYAPGALRARALRRPARGLRVSSARPALAAMRLIKQPAELAQLRQAAAITAAGFAQARRALRPELREYQLEAEFTAAFIAGGAAGHAYEPIVAGGPNATVLHYVRNDRPLAAGQLVLADVGAEYGWYAADVTRVWPVDGRLTPRQREIYQAVLEVQRAAIVLMRPGALMRDIEQAAGRHLTEQLVQLGILTRAQVTAKGGHQLYRAYCPHAISHSLGLDVHDVGDLSRPLQPGMVLTCEPGIYLKAEGLGVRLEDDILVTSHQPENLTVAIPIDPELL